MDPAIVSLIPAGSVGGTLVVVIIYLLRQNAVDRKHYRDDVAAIDARHQDEMKEITAAHTAELVSVRAEITSLKESNAAVLTELDAERRRRWVAEDAAAKYRQRLGITEDA